MAINKKLIYVKTESRFNTLLNNNEIDKNSIVFIEDSKRIWTHGVFFDTSWDYVTGKPNTFTPSAHTHGPITNDGKIGTQTNRIIETTTGGLLTHVAKNTAYNKDFGTGVDQVARGNHTHDYLPLSGGKLTGDLEIFAGNTDKFIKFSYNTTDAYAWRIGYLGTGSGNENRLAFQSAKTSGASYVDALSFGLDDLVGRFAVTPTVGNTKVSLEGHTHPNFTRAVAGFVPAPGATTTTRYLREDGTWKTPPNTTYTAGSNITINASNVIAGNYPSLTKANLDKGTATTQSVATPQVLASWLSGKNYYDSGNLAGATVSSNYQAENNEDIRLGGHISNYGTSSWLVNRPFSGYGGLIAFRMAPSYGFSGLELTYDIGRNAANGGRLAFRTVAGTGDSVNGEQGGYKPWKELWSTGDFAQNDINNWNNAYNWGNHSSAGYALAIRKITAGNGLTGGGDLTANRTITLGTPSAITALSSNGISAQTHTHLLQSSTVNLNTGLNTDIDGFVSGSTGSPRSGSVMGTWTTLRSNTAYGAGFFARANQAWFRTRENGVMQGWNEFWHSGNLTKLSQLSNDLFSSPTFSGDTTITGDIILPKSNGNITWNSATWQQRIATTDTSSTTSDVFTFQESSNSGASWKNLMTIKADGTVEATTFIGALTGNASSATALTTNAGSAKQPIYFSGGKPIASTSTVGGTTTPMYLKAGVMTALGYTIAKSVPSGAKFTDENVKYTLAADNQEYRMLMSEYYSTAPTTLGIKYTDNIRINPYLSKITATTFSGKATSAGNADTANGQKFNWSNTSNSPTYLWATNANGTAFLASRANISVKYATSAGSADSSTKATSANRLNRLGDNRGSFSPSAIAGGSLVTTFSTQGALANQANNSDYSDVIAISSYQDSSAGRVNALSFDKSSYRINHFMGTFGASTWSGFKTLAYLTDNVASATKLQTARAINGTSFDGSANITTANWGTARNIGVVNSDGTGTAVTTSVNGSKNINLRLPSTIKATLTGNADSASYIKSSGTINTDYNNYRTEGIYTIFSDAAQKVILNRPSDLSGVLEVTASTSTGTNGWVFQRFHEYSSDSLYTRRRYGTTWSTWKKSYHTGNFATGTTAQYIRGDGSLATYANTTYSEITEAETVSTSSSTLRTITGRRLKYAFDNITAANAANASKIYTSQKADNVNYQIPFVASVTAGNSDLYTDSAANFTYNPSTNAVSASSFNGITGLAGTGSASTASRSDHTHSNYVTDTDLATLLDLINGTIV